jgi:hypothetical protein
MKSGLKVKWIQWAEGRDFIEAKKRGDITVALEILNENHGSYDLDWVIEKHNGKEVARHNCKLIESIAWIEGETP